ncbi:hypothetical protein KC909_01620 [Candidatus Dojkabacteria bacterium]|uniref:Uncharacterized protein n=1 Tax=Candidatus Dojkabacteria bacterium TaxID=2099670 RepID=A0A955RJ55_9BACT|nr:hypothetical protein [Candidatus Dojkabacteria bacterium]
MSNSLVKLIDNSLLPAILIIFGKFLGIYLANFIFGAEIGITSNSTGVFSFQTVTTQEDLVLVSTFSDLFMFSLVALGFIINLVNAVFFHNSHINVNLVAKLAHLNLLSIVKSSYELYHSGVTWFIFTWVASFLVLFNVALGKTTGWTGIVVVLFSIALSVALFRDLLKEIELSKKKLMQNI